MIWEHSHLRNHMPRDTGSVEAERVWRSETVTQRTGPEKRSRSREPQRFFTSQRRMVKSSSILPPQNPLRESTNPSMKACGALDPACLR